MDSKSDDEYFIRDRTGNYTKRRSPGEEEAQSYAIINQGVPGGTGSYRRQGGILP